MMQNNYLNGYIIHKNGGFEGYLNVDGIDLGEITGGFYTDKKGRNYVWLRRKPILEYNPNTRKYSSRTAIPLFECYAFKSAQPNIAYKGMFYFLHFTYDLVCCWDDVIKDRLNIYVVRSDKQPLIEAINKKHIEHGNGTF